mmetsp:Transcript_30528/g.92323  ORF Transcript_30528/g.92323 Transcript_30528/m.92323 type:complete len:221 (+) Transcript_30528:197-859(+)
MCLHRPARSYVVFAGSAFSPRKEDSVQYGAKSNPSNGKFTGVLRRSRDQRVNWKRFSCKTRTGGVRWNSSFLKASLCSLHLLQYHASSAPSFSSSTNIFSNDVNSCSPSCRLEATPTPARCSSFSRRGGSGVSSGHSIAKYSRESFRSKASSDSGSTGVPAEVGDQRSTRHSFQPGISEPGSMTLSRSFRSTCWHSERAVTCLGTANSIGRPRILRVLES